MAGYNCILFAERGHLDGFAAGLRGHDAGNRSEVMVSLLIAAVLIGALWALSRLWAWRQRRSVHSPRQLFLALCNAHTLSKSDRRLLWRLAQSQRLTDPAQLFLAAELWQPPRMGAALVGHAARLEQLHRQLFSDIPRSIDPEPQQRPVRKSKQGPAPTPLFPTVPAPTLDMPPWTVGS